jgi:hypothetical protein
MQAEEQSYGARRACIGNSSSLVRSFRLILTEGSTYEVNHPEYCMVGRRSAVMGLGTVREDQPLFERSVTLDLLHIVKLESIESSSGHKPNGSGQRG